MSFAKCPNRSASARNGGFFKLRSGFGKSEGLGYGLVGCSFLHKTPSTAFVTSVVSVSFNRRGFATFNARQIPMIAESANSNKLVLPLPSGECLFYLRHDQTVKSFLDDLRLEDSSISNAAVFVGTARVSSSTLMDQVMRSPFSVKVNNFSYDVIPEVGSRKSSVSAVGAEGDVESIKQEIAPLLAKKIDLDTKSVRRTNLIMWGGLGFLCAQWTLLARLTWWEFNWDIMEPVTYFVTFGTAVLGYAYFAVVKRDYSFVDLRENILVNKMFKSYMNTNFDVDKYFALEHKLKEMDPYAFDTLKQQILDGEYKEQSKE